MDYSVLSQLYEKLESTPSKLSKADILAEFLQKVPTEDLPKVVLLIQGRVLPSYSEFDLGVAMQMLIKAIAKATGLPVSSIEEKLKKTGDIGLAAEQAIQSKKQATLLKKKLTVSHVFENLQKLATIVGKGSQERKLNLISELIVSSKPVEARYITRTILGLLRVGTAEGIIRDAIVKAFLPKEEKQNATAAVENAYSLKSDYGEVAKIAKEKGINGLKKIGIELGKPMQVMLGLAADNIETVVKEFGPVIAEFKYDGMRIIIQKKGDKVWLFTRRQEDVTKQFPDIVELVRRCVKAKECIIEGETLGVDPKTGYPIPFQTLSQRIHRKYDIEKMVKEIPVQVNLFDILYANGKSFLSTPLKERRTELQKIFKPIQGKFQLATAIITDDLKKLEEFRLRAIKARQEGLMLKVQDAPYTFGRHVGMMYKIKSTMENLDLVVTGATWGEGNRANWLTSYMLACRDSDTGKFLECGMMSTGLSEDEYKQMTETLKKLIVDEKGKTVFVKPKIVLEVGYQEIQKSVNYESGFALRFPRFVRFREDKGPSETDTIERVKSLYKSQGRAG